MRIKTYKRARGRYKTDIKKRGLTVVCKICGNEADIIIEEI